MSETYRDIKYGKEAKQAIKAGVDKAANAVRVTLGVTGKTVIIENPFGGPFVTDDGVTVAKSIKLKDKYENLGAQLICEVANKTNDTAGDGTTTATVIAQRMLQEAFGDGNLVSEENDTELKQEMEKAVATAIEELTLLKKDCTVEDIEKVATVSSLDPQVGKLIADVLQKVGRDGIVTIEETQKVGIETEVVNGMRFEKGLVSAYMINRPDRQEAVIGSEMGSARVFVTDKRISTNADMVPILEAAVAAKTTELLIVAEEIEGEALATAIMNKMKNGWNIVCVKAPGFAHDKAEHLKNIGLITGAKVYTEELKMELKNVKVEDFGKARKIVVTQNHTTIIDGAGDKEAISEAASTLKLKLADPDGDEFERARYERHLANLIGGIGVIKVGALTETEMKARKYKIEDALNAAKAAIAEGIVIGGGSALCKVGAKLLAESVELSKGATIVYNSLFAPIMQMATNRGIGNVHVVVDVQEAPDNVGYNFKTGNLEDLFEAGIVDPFKVTRLALENAFSIASTIITLEAVVVEIKEEKEKQA